MIDDEKFFAWLDGELGPVEAAEVEAKVASDPQLQRLAQQHRALGRQLAGAFAPIAEAPVPERLEAAVRPSAQLLDFAEAKRRRTLPPVAQFAAMAATLAIGLFIGMRIPESASGPVEVQGGKLYAAGALSGALDTRLASAPFGDVRIGLTFRNQAGEICRSFTQPASSGLACRENGRWQVRGMFAAPEGQGTDYRMAAGMDPNLAALVDSTMAGEPFGAAQERAARQRGWK
jgi:hypothetical protein